MTLTLSPFFSNGMVLQRNTDVAISGKSKPLKKIEVTFGGETFITKSDENGKWNCPIGKYSANSKPQKLKVACKDEKIVIKDVLIGDVWLCSGQSNMELMLNRTHNNYPDEMELTNPLIRQFKVPQIYKFDEPQNEYPPELCAWESFSPETAPNFTAVGYFFAKKISEKYNVPVGLFACAVGGTPIAAWLSKGMLKDFPDDLKELEICSKPDYPAFMEKTLKDYEIENNDYHKRLNQADAGSDNAQSWANPDVDDSDWEEASIFEPVRETGVWWFRKTIEIPKKLRGKDAKIFLGTLIDMDKVYINWEKIGTTYYRYPPREYEFTLPDAKKLTIAVRLLVFGESGGFEAMKNLFIATSTKTFDLNGSWKRKLGAKFEKPSEQTFFSYKPTGLFNGMVSPIIKNYNIRGVLWYQGESDTGNPDRYAEKQTALINGWRKAFGIDNLPFLTVQLAFYEYTGSDNLDHGKYWERLREQQKRCLELKNVGLAAAYDLGEYNDLHPQNKRAVGERLARLAMRAAYKEKLPPNMFEMYNCE